MIGWLLDGLLAVGLLWLGWRTLINPDLLQAVVLFIVFGLFMALCWARLAAPDLALAEAAIGAGLTGALLLDACRVFQPQAKLQSIHQVAAPIAVSLAMLCGALVVCLAWALLTTPPLATVDLGKLVQDQLAESGVSNPVTAVLLNFRAYDTLLEVAVLVLALLGVASLVDLPATHEEAYFTSPEDSMLLASLLRFVLPVAVLTAGYLLWAGAHAPGGAFQAGAVLAAIGVLLKLAERLQPAATASVGLRLVTVLGLAVFCLIALGVLAFGQAFLEYPRNLAGILILVIETALTFSIGLILTLLFAAAPGLRRATLP
jgi:multisubunit Na+/H+ antiporter MnhB subunit